MKGRGEHTQIWSAGWCFRTIRRWDDKIFGVHVPISFLELIIHGLPVRSLLLVVFFFVIDSTSCHFTSSLRPIINQTLAPKLLGVPVSEAQTQLQALNTTWFSCPNNFLICRSKEQYRGEGRGDRAMVPAVISASKGVIGPLLDKLTEMMEDK
jgi:hypothetical protein